MLRLFISVLVEAIVGISLAGLALAVIVPVLNRYRPASAEGTTATIVVFVIVLVTAAVLFRPGSAINRRIRR